SLAFELLQGLKHGGGVSVIRREGRARCGMGHRTGRIVLMRDDYETDGKAEGVGLVLNKPPPNSVHGDAVEGLADASNKLDDLKLGMIRTGVVQGKGTVFAAAPEQCGFFGWVHGGYH